MHPINLAIPGSALFFRVFTEIPSSGPDRLHVTSLAFEMASSTLFGEVCVKPTGLADLPRLPTSAGQAPNYAHFS
jgi:hypothetical protein